MEKATPPLFSGIALMLLLLLTGCRGSWSLYFVAGRFEIEAPGYLQPTHDLHDEAPLQLQNKVREVYLLGRYDKKSTIFSKDDEIDLEAYYDITVDNLIYPLTQEDYSDPVATTLHGMPSLSGTVTGMLNDVPVAYSLVVIESDQNFYQLLGWSRKEDADTYSPDFDRLMQSFKLSKSAPNPVTLP